jgi:hypothetical protein
MFHADLLVVEAHVVVMTDEHGAVVGDEGDVLGRGQLRDGGPCRVVDRVHDQDFGAQVDVSGGIVQLGRIAALRVVDPVLGLRVSGIGERGVQIGSVEAHVSRR